MLARESYIKIYLRDLDRKPNRSKYTPKRINKEIGDKMFFPNIIYSLGRNSYRRQFLYLNFNFFNSLLLFHFRHNRNRGASKLVSSLQTIFKRYINILINLKSRIYTLHTSFSYILNVIMILLTVI
jgi:hypothetical protein